MWSTATKQLNQSIITSNKDMQFHLSSEKDYLVFAQWSKFTPLKERTCRPIRNGKRILCKDVLTFSFTVDGIEELVGRFEYFDLNIRNRSAEFGYTVNPKFSKFF